MSDQEGEFVFFLLTMTVAKEPEELKQKKRLKKQIDEDDDEHKTKEQLAREIAEIEAQLNPKKSKKSKKIRKRDIKRVDKDALNQKLTFKTDEEELVKNILPKKVPKKKSNMTEEEV